MRIIVEGPDGSGKTTLIQRLHELTMWPIVPGEGPEKYPGEAENRIRRYNAHKPEPHLIYDRHPAVSHLIYSQFTNVTKINPNDPVINDFYSQDNLFVYCHPPEVISHQISPHDTPDLLEAIDFHQIEIHVMYETWALQHAHIIHRIPNTEQTVRSIIGAVI